jgi:thiamine biosynthesis lipoprotein
LSARARLGAACLVGLGLAAACSTEVSRRVEVSDGRYAMGTVLEITLLARDRREGEETLDALFALATQLERRMSVYDPESDVSRLNRAAGRGPQRVAPEVAELLARSGSLSRLTRGAFDVTIGPLVELWTAAAERGTLPTPAELARARTRVGSDRLRVHEDGRVELRGEGVSVNLGGIAKGYALDRMASILRERGIDHALLNFGQSSSRAFGRPSDAPGWRLLARGPDDDLLGVLTLRDRALSVSGSLGQWVEIGGRRYGHVIDPRSGTPLEERRQALVVAADAALAEALSKALLVLGESEGLALVAAQAGCEALLADAGGARWRTPGWDAAVSFEALAPGQR